MEEHSVSIAQGIPNIFAGDLRHLSHTADYTSSSLDSNALEELVESSSFNKGNKRNLAAKLCTVLCDTISDKTALFDLDEIILHKLRHLIIVTFSETADDNVKFVLPKELRMALKSHKARFFRIGLTLLVALSIPA